ncbi:Ig-like domain repeat protein [Streptomyces sasae]|uniref:Ig-like domain repeat protein n=2 Tax=Streptomyces sasae TaxID=1266772 RepID=UPI00292FC859|nr:Ig-like domain repeat protein [Streptomyces sasae]
MAKAFQSRWRQLLGIGRNTARRVAAALLLDPTVPVGNFPTGVAINSAGTRAYVANEGDDTVSVIDTATNTVTATINVGSSPFGVAVTPGGAFVYVTNVASDSVSVIDTATNAVTDTISVGTAPFGIAINTAGTRAHVANEGDDTVSVIDTATNTVIDTINVGSSPFGVAFSPAGAFSYATNNGANTVSVIDTATNTVTATINVGSGPTGIAITSDDALAYVTNNSDNTISVIDTATNTVSDTIPAGGAPTNIAITPDDAFAYVTNNADNTVSVLDIGSNTIAFDISVGTSPFGVAFTPNGLHAYVTNNSDNTVSVLDVAPFPTATTLTSTPDPTVFGEPKLLIATVTSSTGVPSGTVTFLDGATPIGSAPLVGGVATLTTSSLAVGSHPLTAVYAATPTHAGSTSPVDIQTVSKANTLTTLVSNPDPSLFGESKVLTAAVTVVLPGGGTPTGTVAFFDGATPLGSAPLVGGVATITVSNLSVGSHPLTATYSGGPDHNGSTSLVDPQTVIAANTTTALTSSPDPSVLGQPKVLTAAVSVVAPGGGTPTGTVTFFDGATPIGTALLSGGIATITVSNLSVGSHPLTATYSGSGDYNTSTSPVDTQTVAKANTATALTSAPDPTVFGQPKVLTATVTAVAPGSGTPTGTVSFFDGATPLGSAPLVGGVATLTTSSLSVGAHPLTAVYAGTTDFNGSISPVDTQTVAKANTATALTSAPDPTVFGQAKVLTATVTAVAPGSGTPTGTVSFFDGATPLGSAPLVGGVATLTTSSLAVGSHPLTATYSGSGDYNTSTSPVDTQTVAKANTATALTSAPDPTVFGQPKVLTATVTAVAPGSGTPTGTVSFFDGATPLGSAPLVGGVATLTVSNLAVGNHSLTATYSGSGDYNTSTSPVDTQTVAKANTATALTSAPDPTVFGQAKTLTATVASVAPGAGTPTGTVSFFDGVTLLGTASLSGGVATLSVSTLGVGSHSLTATYSGSPNHNSSVSPADPQTVNKANTTTALTSAPNPSTFGQSVVLTATVAAVAPGAGTPTGTVSFFDGVTLLGTASLSGGVASFTTSSLSVGSHTLTATYGGSVNYNGSTSPVVTQTVTNSNPPTLVSAIPSSGSTAGGGNVLLVGSNLNGVTGVTFGGTPATIVSQSFGTYVTVVAPPHAAGVVPVVVNTTSGPSNSVNYTYV